MPNKTSLLSNPIEGNELFKLYDHGTFASTTPDVHHALLLLAQSTTQLQTPTSLLQHSCHCHHHKMKGKEVESPPLLKGLSQKKGNSFLRQ